MPLSESHNASTNRNHIIQMIFLFRQLRFLHQAEAIIIRLSPDRFSRPLGATCGEIKNWIFIYWYSV